MTSLDRGAIYTPGREVEVVPGSGEMWEINPKWSAKKLLKVRRRRRAGE